MLLERWPVYNWQWALKKSHLIPDLSDMMADLSDVNWKLKASLSLKMIRQRQSRYRRFNR